MPITLDGSNGITTPTYGGADTSEYLVPVTQFKNRIINGAMVIDQRNAGASVTPTDGQYTLDRWQSRLSQTSKYSIQRSSVAPSGFTSSLLVTSLSAYTVGASEFFQVRQAIEGLNFGDLGWGTANAKTITISFWVRSSLTGTFSGALLNDGGDRCFVFSYTINAANTWEQKSVTISGDTTGTWLTNNSIGVYVAWSLGSGSSVSGTAGSWGSTLFRGATGAVSVVGTNGATFYITGVQLEVGSTATSFDYRPYGTELQLCQRYFETSYEPGNAVGSTVNASRSIAWFNHASSDYSNCRVNFSVYKRASPTIAIYNPATGTVNQIRNLDSGTNISAGASVMSVTGFMGYVNGVSVGASVTIGYHYTASAEL